VVGSSLRGDTGVECMSFFLLFSFMDVSHSRSLLFPSLVFSSLSLSLSIATLLLAADVDTLVHHSQVSKPHSRSGRAKVHAANHDWAAVLALCSDLAWQALEHDNVHRQPWCAPLESLGLSSFARVGLPVFVSVCMFLGEYFLCLCGCALTIVSTQSAFCLCVSVSICICICVCVCLSVCVCVCVYQCSRLICLIIVSPFFTSFLLCFALSLSPLSLYVPATHPVRRRPNRCVPGSSETSTHWLAL
jgi:hypothetical protein